MCVCVCVCAENRSGGIFFRKYVLGVVDRDENIHRDIHIDNFIYANCINEATEIPLLHEEHVAAVPVEADKRSNDVPMPRDHEPLGDHGKN